MKLSNLLPLLNVLMLPATSFASFLGTHPASSFVDSVDSLEHNTDSSDRILKPKSEKAKSEKTKGAKKGAKKSAKKGTKRSSLCDKIEALEFDNKIQCTDDCSDNYLTCVNGVPVEVPLAPGEKCYENGIVLTSDGNCVLSKDGIMTFDFMDACTNYENLAYCSTPVDEDGGTPYKGLVRRDGTWYFQDRVYLTYLEISDADGLERGWRIYITIRFGHDKEEGRSRTIAATMDYGTTRIVRWRVMDSIDGVPLVYNCFNVRPDDAITVLIKEFFENPTLLTGTEEGGLQLLAVGVDNMFTTEVVVDAEDLGPDYLTATGTDGKSSVTVLARREDMNDGLPVDNPMLMYDNAFMFDFEDFTDEDFDFSADENKANFDRELIPEIRLLIRTIVDERMCTPDYDQVYVNKTDVATPIFLRGNLTKSFPRTSDQSDEPEDQTEIGRLLEFCNITDKDCGKNDTDTWVPIDFSDLIEQIDWTTKLSDTELLRKFSDPDVSQDALDELRESLLGGGDGLSAVKILLDDLVEVNDFLIDFYETFSTIEEVTIEVYDLIQLALGIPAQLKKIEKILLAVEKILKLVSIIKQLKAVTIPVRNAIGKLREVIKKKVLPKVEELNKKYTIPAKPNVQTNLTRIENYRNRSATTSSRLYKFLIVPTNITRNCQLTNTTASLINPTISAVKSFFEPAFALIKAVRIAVEFLQDTLAGAIKAIKNLAEAIGSTLGVFSILTIVTEPFIRLLEEEITLSIPGPFCSFTKTLNIPYPCGVNYCNSYWGIRYPCGVKICRTTTKVTVPSFCFKEFKFSIGQIIDGLQGVSDFIFAPLNIAADFAISLIPLPEFPLPQLPSIDFLDLPVLDLPGLPDFNLPPPLDKLPLDLTAAFPEFTPICSSGDSLL